jgi:HAD superfamily hydrolase (TIGR01509 family)
MGQFDDRLLFSGPATLPGPCTPPPACLRSIRGLLFDMGDVLYDATVWRHWLLRLLTRLGWNFDYREFFHVWDTRYLVDVHCGRRSYQEAFQEFLLAMGLPRGLIEEVEAASLAKRRELEATTRPLPGARPTIARLHAAGIVLGVLSDSESPGAALSRRLERLGFQIRFAAVVSSLDLRRAKPEPACYETALERMRLPPAQVAFVGHDGEELAGAAAVGMPTIAFNDQPGTEADLHIERFEELLYLTRSPALAAAG